MWINIAAVAATMLVVLGSGTRESAAQSDVTLRVANFGGVFTASQKKYAGDLFTKRTGIRIQYIDANPPTHLAKMLASRGREAPYDVIYLDDNVQPRAIEAELLLKLDPSAVPNLEYLYAEAKDKDGYGPAMAFNSIGIAYNAEKFKEAGIPELTSWSDLWNPKLAGKIAVVDLGLSQGRALLIAAAWLNGAPKGSYDLNALEKGIEKVATLKAHSYPTSSATIEALFRSGDIWATAWVNGRAWGMIDSGFPLRFVLPKEGAFSGLTTIDVVKGTKYPKEAMAYVNMVLDPLAQLGLANEVPYGPTNRVLQPVLAAYPELAEKFPSSPSDISKLERIDYSVFNLNYSKIVELWNRKIIGR